MPKIEQISGGPLTYTDCNRRRGECFHRAYHLDDGRIVVVVKEKPAAPGESIAMSITNAAEEIAKLICDNHKLDPRKLVYIEHIAPGPVHGPIPDWDLVTFKGTVTHYSEGNTDRETITLEDAAWRPCTRADWAELGLVDPRPFAIEIEDGPGLPVPYTGAVPEPSRIYRVLMQFIAEPGHEDPRDGGEPFCVAWYCDHPAMHGEDAWTLAHGKLSALYRKRCGGADDLKVGDPVLFACRINTDKMICGFGVIGEIHRPPGEPENYLIRKIDIDWREFTRGPVRAYKVACEMLVRRSQISPLPA